jgi:membrane protein YqaA with SNARE-associated domain
MLRRIYDWVIALSQNPRAAWALGLVSAAEASFFPIPPDVMLVPMCIAKREQAWFFALVATIGSVLGGIVGYSIGALLYETVGHWLISLYGGQDAMDRYRTLFAENGHWVILIKGLTPIPYKIVTIAAGVAGYSIPMFIVLSIITRAARFYMVAAILYFAGPAARDFIEKQLGWVTLGFGVLVIGGVIAAFHVI